MNESLISDTLATRYECGIMGWKAWDVCPPKDPDCPLKEAKPANHITVALTPYATLDLETQFPDYIEAYYVEKENKDD